MSKKLKLCIIFYYLFIICSFMMNGLNHLLYLIMCIFIPPVLEIVSSKFIKLTDVEAKAINGHMGFSDSRGLQLIGNIFKQNSLALLLHSADMYATYIIENERVNLDEK